MSIPIQPRLSEESQHQQQQQQSRKRSHQGCWTCKQKRRRCDSTRPFCQNCQRLGLQCEGYEVRLRWGTGIASRGRFMGADKPLEESIPPRPKGRKRDLERKRKVVSERQFEVEGQVDAQLQTQTQMQMQIQEPIQRQSLERELDQGGAVDADTKAVASPLPSLRSQDEILFQEFLTSGVNVLHSTSVNDSLLLHRLPQLCEQSQALYAICLAFQVTLTPQVRPRFFEYFDAALGRFRSELAMSIIRLHDGTLTAGLLLCSIGLFHGLPWTMHLEGMYSILQSHGLDDLPSHRTAFRTHLIEVMGVMDMPTFTVGRQNPSLGVWRRYCQNNGINREDVEQVSGLPRSLLDIFCEIGGRTTEETFWDWPGEPGSFLQCHLWEAFRLAGLLTCRKQRQSSQQGLEMTGGSSPATPVTPATPTTPASSVSSRGARLPRTEVLVARILASLDGLRRGCAEPSPKDKGTLILNAIQYPVFVVGLEVDLMNRNPEWQAAVKECFPDQHKQESSEDYRLITDLLEEVWRLGEGVDVNELARRRGIELGLF